MPRNLITLTVLVATLAACTPVQDEVDVQQALQLAEQMRQGSVATNLDLVTLLSDQLAPLCEVRDLDQLIALAAGFGCSVLPGSERQVLDCNGFLLGEQPFDLRAELEYVGEDGAPAQPGEAASLRIEIEAFGAGVEISGVLTCTPDPTRGIVLSGSLATLFNNGRNVTSDLLDLAAQRVADVGGSMRLIFTAGRVDITVDQDGVDIASGSAAFVGRNALVALQVDGVFSQGEIALGQ